MIKQDRDGRRSFAKNRLAGNGAGKPLMRTQRRVSNEQKHHEREDLEIPRFTAPSQSSTKERIEPGSARRSDRHAPRHDLAPRRWTPRSAALYDTAAR